MTRCQACGKEEPAQAICSVCGKTYCSEHVSRQNHNCFVDPRGVNMGEGQARVYTRTYGSGASKETNPPKADYYDKDRFEQQHGYTAARSPPLWKKILSSPTYMIILICAVMQIIELGAVLFQNPICLIIYDMCILRSSIDYIIARPWTLITHMFMHSPTDIFHILFNMIVLYSFGRYLEKLIGNKSFVFMYLVSGIVAALGFILIEGNTGVGLVGASGAIYGVLGAVAAINPNLQIYMFFVPIPIKIKYMVLVYAFISVLFMGGGSLIAHAAHLSGLIIGLAFGYYYRNRLKDKMRQQNSY
ncbi:Rhomboid protease GlpG [Methanimicrococcus sp. At1]|uniref:Rhomboid protease GlpG n=1 Tax=Methanimicrococcus hacksteinii TaxID=3028293 RepID=A0ABU3VR27_9EURY|nr:rhomboid family intramembrane serine protease [Methanimicrococcus sp. At1]MDV0445863.1 Rhomboid protease GlpG [Methanimicrococcus sp. At1]